MLLILDLIDNIGKNKVFTKMDLRWGYNNVRIKERDKWKTVFLMIVSTYKPIVMFFRLTNSLATFQAMINDLLRDLIKIKNVAAFINNIIVETETEYHKVSYLLIVILKLR